MPFRSSQRSVRATSTGLDPDVCLPRLGRERRAEGGGREILEIRGHPLFLNPRLVHRDRVSRPASVASMCPAGILRFCPPGLAVALILGILSPLAHPSFQPSLAPLFAPLSFPPSHPFALRRGLPISPSLFFLVPRYAHTLAVTSRGQHVGEFKHLPPSSFLNSLRPLTGQDFGQKKKARQGSKTQCSPRPIE